jgi:hypothetical protein
MPNPVTPNPVTPGGVPVSAAMAGVGDASARVLVLTVVAILCWSPAGWADATPPVPAASVPASSWIDTLLAPLDDLSRWVSGLFSRDERFVTDEIQQFKHVVDSDLSPFDALVRQAGFTIASVSVGARVEPQINLVLAYQRRLSEREKAALMTKITDPANAVGTVERSIIMTLLNAAESAYVVRNDSFRLSEVGIELTTSPRVTFTMAPVSHWP